MASALALIPLAWSGTGLAQESPNSFQLPTPSPSPTPAPQGPVDVRSGVPIGPRSIPTRPSPTLTPAPTAAATASTSASERESAATTPSASTGSAGRQAEPSTSAASRSTGGEATSQGAPQRAGDDANLSGGRENDENDVSSTTEPTQLDGTPSDTIAADSSAPTDLASDDGDTGALSSSFDVAKNWPWIGGLAGLAVLLIVGWLWRRRRASAQPLQIEPPKVDRANEPQEVSAAPDRLNLTLDIISATRSVMMLTVDFRVTFANRTDRAVRDLTLSGQLASAQRGGTNAPPAGAGQPIGKIERIGPHQSRSLSGKVQMPMSEVVPLRQGTKPILVPLLHLTLEGAGQTAASRTYVVGLPSATGQGRVHPIPLDVPPGGLPDLKVREIAVSDGSTQPKPEAA